MIKAGLIGYGGIAQMHVKAYELLKEKGVEVELSAICDIEPEKFRNKLQINISQDLNVDRSINALFYTDADVMYENETLDMVDICLPTPLHAPMAVNMMEKGCHVLSEKPMALRYKDCIAMLDTAWKTGRQLMIGQCLRFYPQYGFLKEAVESGTYGCVISAFFERLSGPASWGWKNWFMDEAQSGGCLLDMHIHDIDMARYLFGEPMEVSCKTCNVTCGSDTVSTRLYYEDDKLVCATGDWSLPKAFGFRHGYRVNFEKAAIIFENNKVTVFENDGGIFSPELSSIDGITGEIAYFAEIIKNNEKNTVNPAESAAITVKLIETLKKSADLNGEKVKFYI